MSKDVESKHRGQNAPNKKLDSTVSYAGEARKRRGSGRRGHHWAGEGLMAMRALPDHGGKTNGRHAAFG